MAISDPHPPTTPWWAMAHDPGTRFRNIGGYRVAVRPPVDADTCTGPDVFLLHGMADASDTWNSCLVALKGCRVWRFDLPWSGRDGSAWSDVMPASKWLSAAFELCPAQRGIVIAHSFGSTALLEHLLSGGGTQLDAAMLISPFYCAPGESPSWDQIDGYARGVHERFVDALRIRLGDRHDRDDILGAMAAKLTQRVLPDGVLALFQIFLGSRNWTLDALAIPVSVVLGDAEGPLVTRGAQALAAALPNTTMHTLGRCGHYPMHEQPDTLNRILKQFLAPFRHTVMPPPMETVDTSGVSTT